MVRFAILLFVVLPAVLHAEGRTAVTIQKDIETQLAKDPQSPTLAALYLELAQALKKPEEMPASEEAVQLAQQRATALAMKRECQHTFADLQLRMHRWKACRTAIDEGLKLSAGSTFADRWWTCRFRSLTISLEIESLRYATAVKLLDELIPTLQKLQAEEPTNKAFAIYRIEQHQLAARLESLMGLASAGHQRTVQTLAISETLWKANPRDAKVEQLYFSLLNDLALMARDMGQFIAAEATFLKLVNREQERHKASPSPRHLHDLAMLYGHLGGFTSSHLSTAESVHYRTQAEHYQQQAALGKIETEEDISNSLVRLNNAVIGASLPPLGDANDYYERLEQLRKKHPTIPAYTVHQSRVLGLKLANMSREGRFGEGLELLAKMRAQLQQLHDADPTNPLHTYLLLVHDAELAGYELQAGRHEESRKLHAEQSQRWHRFCEEHADHLYFLKMRSGLLLLSMNFAKQQRTYSLALDFCRESMALQERMAKEAPQEVALRRNIAHLWEGMAALCQDSRDWVGIGKCMERCLAVRESILKDHPTVADYAFDVIDAELLVGQTHNDRERFAEAITCCTNVARLASRWYQEHPKQHGFARCYAYVCHLAAKAHLNADQAAQALPWYTRAIQAREVLSKALPTHPDHVQQLHVLYKERAFLHNRMGNSKEYDADWQKAEALEATLSKREPTTRTER